MLIENVKIYIYGPSDHIHHISAQYLGKLCRAREKLTVIKINSVSYIEVFSSQLNTCTLCHETFVPFMC